MTLALNVTSSDTTCGTIWKLAVSNTPAVSKEVFQIQKHIKTELMPLLPDILGQPYHCNYLARRYYLLGYLCTSFISITVKTKGVSSVSIQQQRKQIK